jgi:hypothetical protein
MIKLWLCLLVIPSLSLRAMDANDRLSYFCETYLECRNQFLKSSDELIRKLPSNYQSKVERGQWKIPSRTDDQLITDWIYLPAEKTTQNLILITSATHGVEGFMGSTVQKYLLTEVFPTFDREKNGCDFSARDQSLRIQILSTSHGK